MNPNIEFLNVDEFQSLNLNRKLIQDEDFVFLGKKITNGKVYYKIEFLSNKGLKYYNNYILDPKRKTEILKNTTFKKKYILYKEEVDLLKEEMTEYEDFIHVMNEMRDEGLPNYIVVFLNQDALDYYKEYIMMKFHKERI